MICDHLLSARPYYSLHQGFPAALEFLAGLSSREPPPSGRVELDGERLFAIFDQAIGRGRAGAKLEVHRRYVDIQVCLAGRETIGWRPLRECTKPTAEFDAGRDIQFFADSPTAWFDLAPEHFAIFWPGDAHAPLAGEETVHKVVVKVAVDWSSSHATR